MDKKQRLLKRKKYSEKHRHSIDYQSCDECLDFVACDLDKKCDGGYCKRYDEFVFEGGCEL